MTRQSATRPAILVFALLLPLQPLRAVEGGSGGGPTGGQPPPPQTGQAGTVRYVPIPLKAADESGILIADVTMDGQQGRFPIDSGAGYGLLVGSHFAARLGKETRQAGEVHGVGGAHEMLQAGDYVLRHTEGKSAYQFATVRIQEHHYTFLFDTGAAINSIEPALVKELGLKSEATDVGVTGGGGSRKNLDRVVLADSVVAGALIRALECYVMNEKAGAAAPPGTRFGGTLGAGFLRDYHAMLDFDAYALILLAGQQRKP